MIEMMVCWMLDVGCWMLDVGDRCFDNYFYEEINR